MSDSYTFTLWLFVSFQLIAPPSLRWNPAPEMLSSRSWSWIWEIMLRQPRSNLYFQNAPIKFDRSTLSLLNFRQQSYMVNPREWKPQINKKQRRYECIEICVTFRASLPVLGLIKHNQGTQQPFYTTSSTSLTHHDHRTYEQSTGFRISWTVCHIALQCRNHSPRLWGYTRLWRIRAKNGHRIVNVQSHVSPFDRGLFTSNQIQH